MNLQDDQISAIKMDVQKILESLATLTTWTAGLDVRITRMDHRLSDIDKKMATKADLNVSERRLEKRFDIVNEGIDRAINTIVALDTRFVGKSQDHEKRLKKLEIRLAA